jgi:hypothetical protein
MFGFYSNRLGCFGSILVSIIGTVLLILLIRSCNGAWRQDGASRPHNNAPAIAETLEQVTMIGGGHDALPA